MPAPLQHVHPQVRRVRELEEEDLLAGDLGDRVQVGAALEDVEGVQADAERGWSAAADDPPRVVVLAHVAAPGERLVRDPERRARAARSASARSCSAASASSSIASGETFEQTSMVGAPSCLHHVELGLGAAQVARGGRGGTASKSRNGW